MSTKKSLLHTAGTQYREQRSILITLTASVDPLQSYRARMNYLHNPKNKGKEKTMKIHYQPHYKKSLQWSVMQNLMVDWFPRQPTLFIYLIGAGWLAGWLEPLNHIQELNLPEAFGCLKIEHHRIRSRMQNLSHGREALRKEKPTQLQSEQFVRC